MPGGGDTVTIIYPQGCKEVTEDLTPDELIRRLKVIVVAHKILILLQMCFVPFYFLDLGSYVSVYGTRRRSLPRICTTCSSFG